MELRHLQYFLMVAREGTISGAAAALHVSQPSLSRQMQDLERDLGVRLFERGSRRITLTEPGMRLRGRAEEIVDLVGRAETEFRVTAGTLAGEVRVAGGETPAMGLVADAIAVFKDAYPLVRFNLFSGNAEAVGERLDRGRADFGVFVGHADLSRFEFLQLPARDRWGVFMREDDPLAEREVISPADLVEGPFIMPERSWTGERLAGPLATWFGDDGEGVEVAATYNLSFNAALLVQEGVGRMLTLEGLTPTGPDSGLVFRLLYPPAVSIIDVVWKRTATPSRAVRLFLESLREA